jgi:CheY-like chemotaxis protein
VDSLPYYPWTASQVMKILLVDENSSVRGVMRQLMAFPGIHVQECTNGANAIAAYAANQADFVVMDVGSKHPDGIAATEQIKAINPAASIILVSEYDDAVLR